jgi:magnesium-transporting ATPase (P-type)
LAERPSVKTKKCGFIVLYLVSNGTDSINPLSFLTFNFFYLGCCEWWNEHDRRIATLEFDRDRKSMGVIVDSGAGRKSLLVKVLSLSAIA